MELDPLNPPGSDAGDRQSASDARARQLNNLVALAVALLATFMAIGKVKDDNIVQAMQQAQAQLDQLQLAAAGHAPDRYTPTIAKYSSLLP